MKDCGSCAMCCKFLEIPSLEKGPDIWCQHCKIGSYHSCGIYENRPDDCVNFNCFWKAESWYDWLRPDRSKVLFESLPGVETILVTTDNGRPDAWKKEKIVKVIEILKRKGRPIIVRTKNDTKFFVPKGWTQQRMMEEIKVVLDRRK